MRIIQLFSEISIQNKTGVIIDPDDLVEIEISLSGIKYISHEINAFIEDNSILDVFYGKLMGTPYEVIMIQLYIGKHDDEYKEIYIRGENIEFEAKIIGKCRY